MLDGPLEGGRMEDAMYKFVKDGVIVYAEGLNAWDARTNAQASSGLNLVGAEIYRCPNAKTELYVGIVRGA